MPESRIYYYLKSERCLVSKRDMDMLGGPTHLCLNGTFGGRIVMKRQDQEERFHELYAAELESPNPLPMFICQKPTCVCPYYADVDMERDAEIVDLPQFENRLIKVLNDAVRCFFPKGSNLRTNFSCILCSTPPRTIASGATKYGWHLIFPNLFVDMDICAAMREWAVIKLSQEFGEDFPSKGWRTAFDRAVYHNGSLRMIGSWKVVKCASCATKTADERLQCSQCSGLGKLHEPRVYSVKCAYDDTGQPDEAVTGHLLRNTMKAVKLCSIRCPAGTSKSPGWTPVQGCPAAAIPNKTKRHRDKEDHGEDVKAMGTSQWKKLRVVDPIKNPDIHKVCLKLVHALNPRYKELAIRDVMMSDQSPATLHVRVRGPSENFCMNKWQLDKSHPAMNDPSKPELRSECGYHRTNSVWFRIRNTGVQQMCFCQCSAAPTSKHPGGCRGFDGTPPLALSPDDACILFGETCSLLKGASRGEPEPGTGLKAARRPPFLSQNTQPPHKRPAAGQGSGSTASSSSSALKRRGLGSASLFDKVDFQTVHSE